MYSKLYYDLIGGFIMVLSAETTGKWFLCDNSDKENSVKEEHWSQETIAFTPEIVKEMYEGKYVYFRQDDGTDSNCIYLTEDFCKLLGENNFQELIYKKEIPKGGMP